MERSIAVAGAAVLLALALAPLRAASANEIIDLPRGRVTGGYVENDGDALLIIQPGDVVDSLALILSHDGGRSTKRIPNLHATLEHRLPDGRLLLSGTRGPYSRDGYGILVYQMVRVTEEEIVELLWEWQGDSSGVWGDESLQFSHDGTIWGRAEKLDVGEIRGRVFRFGAPSSGGLERTAPVGFAEADERRTRLPREDWLRPLEPGPEFLFLNSAGPVVAIPYNEGAYIVRFLGATAEAKRFAADRSSSTYLIGSQEHFSVWQPDEGLLWSNDYSTWRAYDLRDLDLRDDEPIRPFIDVVLWRRGHWGRPHPERGFVILNIADGRYRLNHLRFDPDADPQQIDNRDLHVHGSTDSHQSDWVEGTLGTDPIYFVSPDGVHAIAVEASWNRTDEPEGAPGIGNGNPGYGNRYRARRLELSQVDAREQ